jgi:hypothetical protein
MQAKPIEMGRTVYFWMHFEWAATVSCGHITPARLENLKENSMYTQQLAHGLYLLHGAFCQHPQPAGMGQSTAKQ